jgi:glycosyltransferase involved in cell wall biosynthesis
MPKVEFRGLSVENLAKYWRYCRIYGVRNATQLAILRLQKPMGKPPTEVAPLSLPIVASSEDLIPPIDKTVSVVVPTKNAATYIENLLQKLKAQKGIRPCEIILVDSESTDGTVAMAEREDVIVRLITPREFTHSFSRNAGAERATGDYLLFMVQDALPLTNLWLWEMVTALETNKLAAISCAEYPRSDSDLFYQFLIHDQYNSPGLEQDRILAWDKSCSSYLGLRSNARISDVAALIRRDIFENYRYKTEYAEDLELGIRLIRDGHRLGFLHTTRVLHSHNRPSYYFLKRGYVDVRFLVEVFSNYVFPKITDQSKLYCDIVTMCHRVNRIARELPNLSLPLPVKELTDHFLAMLSASQAEPALDEEGLESEFQDFMQQLSKKRQTANSQSSTKTNMITPHVMAHVERLQNWICTIYDVADRHLADDIATALEKVFALHSGTHLAYLYLTLRNRGKLDEALITMDKTLTAGV